MKFVNLAIVPEAILEPKIHEFADFGHLGILQELLTFGLL